MVEQRGLEPLASALRTRRSAKLSYCPTQRKNTVSSFRFQEENPQITQITQNRRQKAEGRKQKAGGRRQEAGGRKQ